jgi:uncharacterized protein YkwD
MRVGFLAAALAAAVLICTGCGGAAVEFNDLNSISDLQDALNDGLPTTTPRPSTGGSTSGGTTAGGSTSGGSTTSGGTVSASSEIQAMLERHNATRTSLGLKPLKANTKLMKIAQQQAEYNASIGKLSHSDALGNNVGFRATTAGYIWSRVGENIAYATSATKVYNNWLGSSGHYKNITNGAYTEVGIGRVKKGQYEFWCVDFAAPR